MRRNIFISVITALMLLMFSLAASAQHGRTEVKKVTFPKGEQIVVLKGRIPSVLVTHTYAFKAREGEVLLVRLSSNNKDITFAVFNAKDFEAISADAGKDRTWRDTISSTEEYSVIVSGLTAGNYVLTIELKPGSWAKVARPRNR